MEEEKNQETVPQQANQEQETETQKLIKTFDEKISKMQESFETRLAEKDAIIKQLIMGNGKNEPEMTDDEKSCQSIIQNINNRR